MKKTKLLIFCFALIVAITTVGCGSSKHQTAKSPEYSGGSQKKESSILHDPIEDDPKYKNVFEIIDAEVDENLKDNPMRGGMGFCHVFWETKKKILKEKYGIPWKSPAEMNPHILFD